VRREKERINCGLTIVLGESVLKVASLTKNEARQNLNQTNIPKKVIKELYNESFKRQRKRSETLERPILPPSPAADPLSSSNEKIYNM